MKRHFDVISYLLFFLCCLFSQAILRISLFFFNVRYFDVSIYELAYFALTGIRFDMSVVSIAALPVALFYFSPLKMKNVRIFRMLNFVLAVVPQVILLIPNIFDIFYYPYVLRRSTAEIFSILSIMKQELPVLWQHYLISFIPALLLFILFSFFIIISARKFLRSRHYNGAANTFSDFLFRTFILLIVIFVHIIFIRGGFQRKPIGIVTAQLYASGNNTNLVLNSSFTILKTYNKNLLAEKTFFDENNSNKYLQQFSLCKQFASHLQPKNIIIVILEGFSTELLQNNHAGVPIYENYPLTPFLDSLIQHSLYFNRAYANGMRSIDAIPAIFSSIPTLMNTPWLLSPYSQISHKSLPHYLKEIGYRRCLFFHGGHNGTMNFDVYARFAGFDNYIGMNQYPDRQRDYDGKWGIFDEPFLKFIARYLDTLPEPFMAGVFTLSSHHPYTLPEQYKKVFPDTLKPFHKTVAYTDLALRQFFHQIQQAKWFKNSIIVITSDHTTEPVQPLYKKSPGVFSIPLIIHIPERQEHQIITQTTQQIDIMPTLLHAIGSQQPIFAFGNSVFDTTFTKFAIQVIDKRIQIIVDSLMYIFDNDKLTSATEIATLSEIPINLLPKRDDINMLYQSFIQQYTHYLLKGKVYCKKKEAI